MNFNTIFIVLSIAVLQLSRYSYKKILFIFLNVVFRETRHYNLFLSTQKIIVALVS